MPAEDGQRRFSIIPDSVGPIRNTPERLRPMTSKQVRKEYLKRNRETRLSREEERRLQAQIRDDLKQKESEERKERERERARVRAEAQREKQRIKDEAEKLAKRKAGVPLKPPRPSQGSIANFVKGGGIKRKRDSAKVDIDLNDDAQQRPDVQVYAPGNQSRPNETLVRTQSKQRSSQRPAAPIAPLQDSLRRSADNASCQKQDEEPHSEMGPPPLSADPSRKKRKMPFLIPGQSHWRPKITPGPTSTVTENPNLFPSPGTSYQSSTPKFCSPRHSENHTFDITSGTQRFLRSTQAKEQPSHSSLLRKDTTDLIARLSQRNQEAGNDSNGSSQKPPGVRGNSPNTSHQPVHHHHPCAVASNLCNNVSFDGMEDYLLSGTQLELELSELDSRLHSSSHRSDRQPVQTPTCKIAPILEQASCHNSEVAISQADANINSPGWEDILPFLSTQDCSFSAEDLADIETPTSLNHLPVETSIVTQPDVQRRPHIIQGSAIKSYHAPLSRTQRAWSVKTARHIHAADDPNREFPPASDVPSHPIKEATILMPRATQRSRALSPCPAQPKPGSSYTVAVVVSSDDLRVLHSTDWGDDLEIDLQTKEDQDARPDSLARAGQENRPPFRGTDSGHCMISTQDMRVLHSIDWGNELE